METTTSIYEPMFAQQTTQAYFKPLESECESKSPTGLFSFFSKPVTNITPTATMTVLQAYNAIRSEQYAHVTRVLRTLTDNSQARNYKARNFDYCCYSGTFTTRSDKNLIQHSGFLTLDFDHIEHVHEIQDSLINNIYFETVLSFISPSGDGFKWIVKIDLSKNTHFNWFQGISSYIRTVHQITVDRSGKDVSRCCFLPYDPTAYINPKYI